MHSVDIRADVYSLGATLYKLLTGKSPFADARFDTSMKKLVALATLQPKPVATLRADVPTSLSQLVARLLAKSPDDRPGTAGEVAALLQPFCTGADVAQLMRSTSETAGKVVAPANTEDSFKSASVDTASTVLKPLPEPQAAKPGDPRNNRRLPSAAWLLTGLVLLFGAALFWFNLGPGSKPPIAVAPFAAAEAKSHQQAWARYLGLPVEHTNSIGMKFRLIPPGEFLMGSTSEEIEEALQLVNTNERISRECVESGAPQHRVRITEPFYLSVCEVTQNDYEAVQGVNPAKFQDSDRHADHPVEMVSWNDAVAFCVNLSEQEGLTPHYSLDGRTWLSQSGSGYRLPSEAEWEYACRAGTTTKYVTGNRDDELTIVAWLRSGTGTHPIGKLPANPFGLHDMHGNVWEWCQDAWDPAYYQQFDQITAADPQGPPAVAGAHRVHRGGSWMWGASRCRSSYRDHEDPVSVHTVIGFRVALPVEAVRKK
jgi:formylglycine-generating enzyme required for sulfatase activity